MAQTIGMELSILKQLTSTNFSGLKKNKKNYEQVDCFQISKLLYCKKAISTGRGGGV